MTRPAATRLAVAAALLAIATPVARAATDSAAQLQKLYDDGKYTDLLPKLKAALAAKGPTATAYDRYQLLMLQGETQLRVGGAASSVASFRAAAAATTDDKQVGESRATAALMAKVQGTKYRAKPAPRVANAPATQPAVFDVTIPDERKQAFASLLADMLVTDAATVDRVKKATALAPLTTAATTLGDLRPVELQATGDDSRSKDLLKSVGDRAVELMAEANKHMGEQVTTIDTATAKTGDQPQPQQRGGTGGKANTVRGNGGANVTVPGTMGGFAGVQPSQPALSVKNEAALRDIVSTARKIDATAEGLKSTFGTAVDFAAVKSGAAKVADDANEVLKKYGKAVVK